MLSSFYSTNKEKVYLQLGKTSVREVLSVMTLEKKATLAGEVQSWIVMSSYNQINGAYTSESMDLLTISYVRSSSLYCFYTIYPNL